MIKEPFEQKTLNVKWPIERQPIAMANAFKFIYNPFGVTMSVGFVDPEYLLLEKPDDELITVGTLGRFQLSIEDFKRLKFEIDKAVEGLKSKGVKL